MQGSGRQQGAGERLEELWGFPGGHSPEATLGHLPAGVHGGAGGRWEDLRAGVCRSVPCQGCIGASVCRPRGAVVPVSLSPRCGAGAGARVSMAVSLSLRCRCRSRCSAVRCRSRCGAGAGAGPGAARCRCIPPPRGRCAAAREAVRGAARSCARPGTAGARRRRRRRWERAPPRAGECGQRGAAGPGGDAATDSGGEGAAEPARGAPPFPADEVRSELPGWGGECRALQCSGESPGCHLPLPPVLGSLQPATSTQPSVRSAGCPCFPQGCLCSLKWLCGPRDTPVSPGVPRDAFVSRYDPVLPKDVPRSPIGQVASRQNPV